MEDGVGPRRTRSQVAPDWTVQDSLILVNVIAAVERDCLEEFSSYQKWQMIAENCAALHVVRSLNQCRRKWDSLREDYKKIKQFESRRRGVSYWSLEEDQRKEFGLPETFDDEIFKVIGSLLREQEDQLDTDPDSDPEAENGELDIATASGAKRKRVRLFCDKHYREEKLQKIPSNKPWDSSSMDMEKINLEETERRIAMELHRNAEMILAIVNRSLTQHDECGFAKWNSNGDIQSDIVRCQADKLIECFGGVVKTLGQLNGLVGLQDYKPLQPE